MRKLCFVLALCMALMLTACGGDVAPTAPSTAPVTTAPDTTPPTTLPPETVPPTTLSPETTVPVTQPEHSDLYIPGLDVEDVILYFNEVAMSFDACQTAVGLGSVDMAISGFSWKEDRAENYNLSDYYWAGDNEDEQILITLAGNEGKYDSIEKLSGLKVGAQTASLQLSLAEEQLADCEIIQVTDLTTAIMQLRNGDFDVLAVAGGNADAMMVNNTDIIKTGFNFEVDPKYTGNVILMTKGSDELTKTVNELLAKAEAAGMYDTWYAEAQETAGIQVIYDDEGNAVETLP